MKNNEMSEMFSNEKMQQKKSALGLLSYEEPSGLFDLSPVDGVNRIGKRTRRGSGSATVNDPR